MNLKNICFLVLFALGFQLILSLHANALNFTDTTYRDFTEGSGFENNISINDIGYIELAEEDFGRHYTYGYFESRVFDGEEIVKWTNITWSHSASENQSVNISIRFSDDNINWGKWKNVDSGENLENASRYAQYRAELSTTDQSSTPKLYDVVVYYEVAIPEVRLNSPADGFETRESTIVFNCSATDYFGLESITFYWNYSGAWEGETVNVSGKSNSTVFIKTGLEEGVYAWNCFASNINSRSGWGSNRTVSVNFSAVVDINSLVTPQVIEGENVSIAVNASTSPPFEIDSVWAFISLPNGMNETISLINNGEVNYTASVSGTYWIIIYANDTAGNQGSFQTNFTASEILTFRVRAMHPVIEVLQVDLEVYLRNTKLHSYTMAAEEFSAGILNGTYDFHFLAFNKTFVVVLKGINVSDNLDKRIGFDRLVPPASGFAETYAVNTTYLFDSAEIKIYYAGSERIVNESHISIYKCKQWDFYKRKCLGSWEKMISQINTEKDYIKSSTDSLSAFSIKQELYCGDDICSHEIGETEQNCPNDCICPTGERRSCGSSDIGVCKYGIQTCINGKWGECEGVVEPSVEKCNAKDDDCDGVIDNVGNGTNIEETKCQCYAGNFPVSERCNGIDDDCDGEIDESLQRECGTDTGICDFGISTCVNGRWSECIGAINPMGADVCGNKMDDDCDGMIDEDCPDCNNGIMDGDEEGVDCGGSCPHKCLSVPWFWMIVGAIILLVIAVVLFLMKRRGPNWDELERRYSYQPPERSY